MMQRARLQRKRGYSASGGSNRWPISRMVWMNVGRDGVGSIFWRSVVMHRSTLRSVTKTS
jgi:hypothetical protein